MSSIKKIAVFPGSFDPFTIGHEDIVKRGVQLFDEVIIAIGQNSTKSRHFPLEEMRTKIERLFVSNENISVITYSGLTTDLLKELDTTIILRGLRNTIDFEYEKSIAASNKMLGTVETIYLNANSTYDGINSTIVREIHKNKGDISSFVPFKL